MPENPVRIAMWSGPRNISTALMRSWGNRPDASVCDEPFYAYYLTRIRPAHPGVNEVIEHHETDWRKVVDLLTGLVPDQRNVFYQKHMAHHLLPEIDRAWVDRVRSGFLIRDPKEMLTSLAVLTPRPSIEDTGLLQQVELFEYAHERTGRVPPVVDSKDLLCAPEPMLRRLCESFGVEFRDEMLAWPPGRRRTDGVWAKHWYDAVERSTGFQPYRPKTADLPEGLEELHERCLPPYRFLHQHRLRVGDA